MKRREDQLAIIRIVDRYGSGVYGVHTVRFSRRDRKSEYSKYPPNLPSR